MTLTAALADSTVSRVELQPGNYLLTAALTINWPRNVVIAAAVPGSVVLDAQASATSERRVLTIGGGTVTLSGLNITGGFLSNSHGGGHRHHMGLGDAGHV